MKQEEGGNAFRDQPISQEIKNILENSVKIAVVGISPKEERPSNVVARYLIEHGYEIVPVNPGQKEVLGRKCYSSLAEIPFRVDMADIFLNPGRVLPVVEQAIEKGIRVVWMQLGVINEKAAQKAKEAGIQVVMDRCVKIEHERLVQPKT